MRLLGVCSKWIFTPTVIYEVVSNHVCYMCCQLMGCAHNDTKRRMEKRKRENREAVHQRKGSRH